MRERRPAPGVRLIERAVPLGQGFDPLAATWWVPTQEPPLGITWLQHGYARDPDYLASLAGALSHAGLLVVMPSVPSFRRRGSLEDSRHLDAIGVTLADLTRPGGPVHRVADTCGVPVGSLPNRVVLVGHSAGAAVIARAAATACTTAACEGGTTFAGIVVLDATDNLHRTFTTSLPRLRHLDVRGVFARPSWCNRNGQGARALRAGHRGFVGVRLVTGSHCDAEGDDTDRVCGTLCGRPNPVNVALLYEITTTWTRGLATESLDPRWEPGGARLREAVDTGRLEVI